MANWLNIIVGIHPVIPSSIHLSPIMFKVLKYKLKKAYMNKIRTLHWMSSQPTGNRSGTAFDSTQYLDLLSEAPQKPALDSSPGSCFLNAPDSSSQTVPERTDLFN